jgi:hypothetical protein
VDGRDDVALVEVRAVHRRQVVNAVVHGSSRSWTSARRRWPAVLAGLLLVVVALLAVGVVEVIRDQVAAGR